MKNNWEVKTIGELCNLATGGTPSRNKPEYFNGGEIKWLVSGDIHKKEIYDCEGRITEDGLKNSNARFLPINSVLIALNGQGKTRGTVALLKTKATCNQSLVSIYPKDTQTILPEYIFCNLHGRYEEIRKITGDDDKDRRGLNMPLIRAIKIPIPPLAEQQRIVTILDEAFAAIGTAKENAEKNLQNSRELFDSYLQSVFANPSDGWEVKPLNEISEVKDGTHDSPQYVKEGIPFVTQKNVTESGLSLTNTKFITDVDHEKFYKRSNVTYGDILISMIGANRGMACIVDSKTTFSIKNVGLVKSNEKINQNYLLYFLKSPKATNFVKVNSKGGAQEFIGLTELRRFPIIFAPLPEQENIVRKLDALSAETKKLENIYRQKINDLDELKKSILQKAFNGELMENNRVSNRVAVAENKIT